MNLGTVLILGAALAIVILLAVTPGAPARRNPFPGRRRVGDDRSGASRPNRLPGQRGIRHHTG